MMSDKRKMPCFGVVSGAGPMAGVILMKHIIEKFQMHGAWKDCHFPEIRLINFPFSEMLEYDFDADKVQNELLYCIKELEKSCDYIVIACQTIHLFLPQNLSQNIINLFDLIKEKLEDEKHVPFILTSITSAKHNLHGKALGRQCEYFDPEKSQDIINNILKGKKVNLDWLIKMAEEKLVIIGCTDYSVALEEYPRHRNLIDPLQLVASRIYQLTTE